MFVTAGAQAFEDKLGTLRTGATVFQEAIQFQDMSPNQALDQLPPNAVVLIAPGDQFQEFRDALRKDVAIIRVTAVETIYDVLRLATNYQLGLSPDQAFEELLAIEPADETGRVILFFA